MANRRTTHPAVAAVLSFFLNGLGQIYNGHISKGLVIIFFSVAGMAVVFAGLGFLSYLVTGSLVFRGQIYLALGLIFAGFIAIGALGVYSMIDAYDSALRK